MRWTSLLLLLLTFAVGCGPTATASDRPAEAILSGYHRVDVAIQESYPCPPVCKDGVVLSMSYIHYDARHVQRLAELIKAAGPEAILVDFDSAKADGTMHHWHAVYAPDRAQ